jgi:hypothetical protein
MEEFIQMETVDNKWKEMSPMGYVGEPALASPEKGAFYECRAVDIADAIARYCSKTK